MAPQTPGGVPSLASASNAKKKTTEKAARNSSMVETRRAAAPNLLLGKEKVDIMQGADQFREDKPAHQKKKVGKSVIQKKDQKEIAHDDSEEEAGNEGLFLTPQRGNTPRLEDNSQRVKPPSAIYEALIRFPCPKPHQMSNIIVISNDLSIIQANVNKSQIVSNSLLNDPELEKCAFLLLTEPWSHMAEESYSVPYIILIVSHFSRRK